MKSLLIILAALFFIGTGAIANNVEHKGDCVTSLKGLTEKQIEQINQLETEHQKIMADFRTERRATSNNMVKDKVRAKMLNQKEAHHLQIKEVLTAEQWKEFEALHENGNNHGQYANNKGKGKGKGRGHGNGNGHGNSGGCNGNHSGHGVGNNSNGQHGANYHSSNACRSAQLNLSNIDTNKYQSEEFQVVEL